MYRLDYYRLEEHFVKWFLTLESATEFIANLSMIYDIDSLVEM